METTFSFGYWVRRRRMALNLTQATLAHQVGCATVSIKKIERDERRPSRTMAERLADILMIAPAERENFIRGALGEAPVDALPVSSEPLSQTPFQVEPHELIEERHRFVGREQELAWLAAQLELAMQGKGRIVFIAGEAGGGKTALMDEFIRRATRSRAELLAAGGTCNAYAGAGDPYLPFREVLGLLTSEVEAHWTAAAGNPENTRRVWRALPGTLQVLVDHGPQLIDVFVPAKGLLARARAAAPGGAVWLSQLQVEVARRRTGTGGLDQSALFGQFTDVLRHLARRHPLLITLDDLHWSDEASLGLLFHVSRRLSGYPILILGTYRPEELAFGRNGGHHPLEGVLGEIKRMYGDTYVDLAADQDGGRKFVDAFLDTEPNRLDAMFRQAFFRQTGGHPLFTVELLREMQARGVLVQDATGHWCEGMELDWDTLPARVEAVIGQRLHRLDSSLRDILTIASVEGELFTAEIVAQVLKMEERPLLQSLSQQLARRHRLVHERGEVEVGGRYLSPYQFGHSLFQQFLYQQLDPGERRRLHGEVAGALEALYRDQTDEIAVQLARHFQEARAPQKAVDYLWRAGVKAMRLSALEEAISLLGRGLELLRALPATVEGAQHELKLQLALGEALHKDGQLTEAMDTFQRAGAVARETGSPEGLARAALGYEESRWRFNLWAEPAAHLLEEALNALGEADNVLKVRVQVSLVRTLMSTSSPEQFALMSQQALELARRSNDALALYDALYLTIRGDRRPERSAERLAALDEMLRLAEEVGSREGVLDTYGFRSLEYLEIGDAQSFWADYHTWIRLAKELHQPFYDYTTLSWETMLASLTGPFEDAERLAVQAMNVGQQMRVENVDGVFGIQMFTVRREQGRLHELAPIVKLFVEQHSDHAVWRPGLALIYSELGLRPEAQREFERLAADDFAGLPRDGLWVTCMAYLAEVCAFLNDSDRAASLHRLLLPYAGRNLVVGFISACFGSASRYLGLLATTLSRWAEAEQHFQEALEMNTQMGAKPWLAHTQHQYASMLLARGWAEDRNRATVLLNEALQIARQLGMVSLAAKVTANME